jgi:uncharacterized cupredoxin-like copper-binding protein
VRAKIRMTYSLCWDFTFGYKVKFNIKFNSGFNRPILSTSIALTTINNFETSMKHILTIALISLSFASYASGSGGHSHGQDDHGKNNAASSVGKPANPNSATKTIHVSLLDTMRYQFEPKLSIRSGEVVRFILNNKGQIRHEFSIGNAEEQHKHLQMMRRMPNMVHEDGNSVTLEPGEKKEITWHFMGNEAAVFACNIPGHFEAGMHATTQL